MSQPLKTSELQDLRKGIIVFVILLASIIATGVYLFSQTQTLHQQYDHIQQTGFQLD
ncbi:MAG: hypothetical protein OXF85_01970 [Candidatus Saccharibacteria bacterium]|nr:hypothetical protein [Candidatus Saccharibacteria bacterium]MCY4010920.1 hypothetical protein [Candidatus Saccharibacteria bacterium]MCY4088609.1 hypothetical protein [Candidatus Saccharibacteria bacterium]